ncbi:YbaB/EbfC family nucleoid-associated protein [soil metagenome]|jgi:DNA-binding YbaB/EbfC family protein
MSNMNQMLRQAQAMQRKLARAQEELATKEVSGSAGGGVVTAVVAGGGTSLKSVTIDPDAVDPDDVEMLQDMVVAAVNEALRAAKELESETMGDIAGGLGLPPGLV